MGRQRRFWPLVLDLGVVGPGDARKSPSFDLDWTEQPQICRSDRLEPRAALSKLHPVCGILGRDDWAPGSQKRAPTWLEEQGSGHVPCWALAPCPPFCWYLLGTRDLGK